jgi:hypothetical protein
LAEREAPWAPNRQQPDERETEHHEEKGVDSLNASDNPLDAAQVVSVAADLVGL